MPEWLNYVGLARELLAELQHARSHGSFALINAQFSNLFGALGGVRADLHQLRREIRHMANEVEQLKSVVTRLEGNVETLSVEVGRSTGELRELAAAIGNVTDLQQIGELTTRLGTVADRLDTANAALKSTVDEVDTDQTHPEPAAQNETGQQ